ncbi:unnamed protein product [Parajaminaea phylloscopi]
MRSSLDLVKAVLLVLGMTSVAPSAKALPPLGTCFDVADKCGPSNTNTQGAFIVRGDPSTVTTVEARCTAFVSAYAGQLLVCMCAHPQGCGACEQVGQHQCIDTGDEVRSYHSISPPGTQ